MTLKNWVSVAVMKHPVVGNYAKTMDFWPALRNLKKQGSLFKSYKTTCTHALTATPVMTSLSTSLRGIARIEVSQVRFASVMDAYACSDLAKESFEMKTRSLVQEHLAEEVNQTFRPD